MRVDAKGVGAECLLHAHGRIGITRRGDDGRRLPLNHLAREAWSGQADDGPARHFLRYHIGHECERLALDTFAGDDHCGSVASVGGSATGERSQHMRWRYEQDEICTTHCFPELARGVHRVVEGRVGQEPHVFVTLIYGRDDIRLVGPQNDTLTVPGEEISERSPPRTCSHDTHAHQLGLFFPNRGSSPLRSLAMFAR
jgi:hypothetical protein